MIDIRDSEVAEVETVEDQPELQYMELRECAFYGTHRGPTTQIMKFFCQVNGHTVKILLDSSSSHNFVDSKLLKH